MALLLVAHDDPGGSTDADGTGRAEVEGALAEHFGTTSVEVTGADGGIRRLRLLLADTAEERRRGLMEVGDPDLDGHDGMLFRFDEDTTTGFWMRNTPLPLSIAYLDATGELVSTADMAPCADSPDCPSYRPAGAYRLALEAPQGRLDDLGIEPGASLAVG